MNYDPSRVPLDPKDLPAWLDREVRKIASAISERAPRLWYAVSILTPAQLTGDTNDLAPPGLEGALWLRLSWSAPFNLTGLKNPDAGTPRILIVSNVGTQTGTLVHGSASSAAANRFALKGSANLALTANAGVILGYDPQVSLWRSLADAV